MKYAYIVLVNVISLTLVPGCVPTQQDSWKAYKGGGSYSDIPFVSDGKCYVLFSSPNSGRGDIVRYDIGMAKSTTLVSTEWFDANAIAAKDGRAIYFEREKEGLTHIYGMRADGTHQRQVSSGAVNDSLQEVSDDGSKLIIRRSPSTQSGLERVTYAYLIDVAERGNASVKCGTSAMLSSDNRSVFFTPADDSKHIYSSDLSLRTRKKVTAGTYCYSVSRRNPWIAIARGKQAWLIDLATGDEKCLAEGHAIGFVGDDDHLLIMPHIPGKPIYALDSKTLSQIEFKITENAGCSLPRISSDGKCIAVRLNNNKQSRAGNVYVIDVADGKDMKIWPE